MTELLYNTSAYIRSFEATVLSCEPSEERYAVVLDKTAFFPEQGGQYADRGVLNGIAVCDVQIRDGVVYHYTEQPIVVGAAVVGELCFETRFDRMQNHTGEHLVSGCIHSLFGYDNVGFHMNDECLTLDTSGYLTKEQLDCVERMANRAVFENLPVEITYPDDEMLKNLSYRSKMEISDRVRIVTVPGYDACACCAPHVASTGEVGLIKIVDAVRYKGGMRITLKCGSRALADYGMRLCVLSEIAVSLSVKPEEAFASVQRLSDEISALKLQLAGVKKELISCKCEQIPYTEGNLCMIEREADADTLRAMVNLGVEKCTGICAAFAGSDNDGYRFVIGSKTVPLRTCVKEITQALDGRGGGSDAMVSGTLSADAEHIRSYIAAFDSSKYRS